MSFLAPLLLLAAAALAIPLLLHLFRKREEAVRTFPALRYLKESTRERATLVRLRQLLLLALRLAALALAILAGARLVLPLGGSDHPPAGVALIVDNSLSSARVVGERRVLDHLVDRALAALDRTGAADRIWVLPAGEPWRPAVPVGTERARALVRSLEPSAARANLPGAVVRARSLLEAGAPPIRQILVLSDLDRSSFPTDAETEPAGDLPLVVGSLPDPLPPNRAIARVALDGGLPPRADRPVEVSVSVSGSPVAGQALRLRVGESLVTAGRTDEDGQALLNLAPARPGWLAGRVEMDPDALRLDDTRYFALPVRPPPPVRPVEPLPAYLETALEVLVDRDRVAHASAGTGTREVGVEADGRTVPGRRPTLVFPPADPALLPAVNLRLEELGTGWRLGGPDPGDGTLLLEEGAPDLRLPPGLEVRRRYPLQDPGDEAVTGARVLARLSDGSPWVVHVPDRASEGGASGLVLVGSPPEPDGSGLPASAAMVPFLAAALELLDGGIPARDLTAGQAIPLPEGSHRVRPPGGTPEPVEGISLFLETGRAGVYDVEDRDGQLLARVAVNPGPPFPGDDRLSPDDAAARLGPEAVGTSGAGAWNRAVLRERRGREVWRPLVLAAFLLLLAEGWIASGSGGRTTAGAPAGGTPAGSGSSDP